jgi:serine phosphatase RsbU (regulator of sigma subunit)
VAAVSHEIHEQTEQRLLERATEEAAAMLDAAVSEAQAPLVAAARAAEATDGDPAVFTDLVGPIIEDDASLRVAALVAADSGERLAVVGDPSAAIESTVGGGTDSLPSPAEPVVTSRLDTAADPVVAYLIGDPRREQPRFYVYAEHDLAVDSLIQDRADDGQLAALDHALYLGGDDPEQLLSSSAGDIAPGRRRATATIPIGDTELVLVMTPTGQLGSWLLAQLWWIVLVSGVIVTLAAAALLRRLNESREQAVVLANETVHVYHEQRDIAETLQLALLPQHLRSPPGSELATRYWPAVSAHLIGGDFYDVFQIDRHRWALVIGDVCGHGFSAAALTGLIRHTLRSAARFSYSPAEMLRSIHAAVVEHDPNTFCTVCLIVFMPDRSGGGELIVALGGHPQPLLRRRQGEVSAIGTPGTLLGMVEPDLVVTSTVVEPGDTLVLYTDGLTDAPGEHGVPLSEIESTVASKGDLDVGELADSIRALQRARLPEGTSDDTALLVIRFGPAPCAG